MSEQEKVNHPKHYNYGQIEVIDIIKDAGMLRGFCIGNVIKYVLRAEHKGREEEDLKKARWYLDYWISELEKNKKQQVISDEEKENDPQEKTFRELVEEGQILIDKEEENDPQEKTFRELVEEGHKAKREFLKKMGRL